MLLGQANIVIVCGKLKQKPWSCSVVNNIWADIQVITISIDGHPKKSEFFKNTDCKNIRNKYRHLSCT